MFYVCFFFFISNKFDELRDFLLYLLFIIERKLHLKNLIKFTFDL